MWNIKEPKKEKWKTGFYCFSSHRCLMNGYYRLNLPYATGDLQILYSKRMENDTYWNCCSLKMHHFRVSAIKIKGVRILSKERHTLVFSTCHTHAYTKFVTLLRTKPSEIKTCISLIDSKIGTLSALFVDCMSKCIKDAIKVHTSPRLLRSKPFHFCHIILRMYLKIIRQIVLLCVLV